MRTHHVILTLAAAAIATPLYVLAFGRGEGAWFQSPPAIFDHGDSEGWHMTNATFADFDQDGLADAVACDKTSSMTSAEVTVFRGLGNGQFTLVETFAAEDAYPSSEVSDWEYVHMASADINGDDWTDIVLKPALVLATGERVFPFITYLNTGGSGFRCMGDINGDGETQVHDLIEILEDWGCEETSPR